MIYISPLDTDICNYADDTTLYAWDKNLNNVIARLENYSSITIKWFVDNFMKLNTNICHLLFFCRSSNKQVVVYVGDSIIGRGKAISCCDRQKTLLDKSF